MSLTENQISERLRSIDTEALLKLNIRDFYNELGPKRLGLFANEESFKLFVLDYLLKSLTEDSAECPIKYYSDDEKEEHLTDDYINKTMKG